MVAQAKLAILIPCYNEAPTIGEVVAAFKRIAPSADVYVYDNNSTDGSGEVALGAGAIVVPECRQGKGFVVRSMFRDIDADCYVMVDGDNTYPAEDALALSRQVLDGRADMVIGDRLSSTYFSENSRPFHGIGNRLVRWLVNGIFRSDIRDVMTGCRAFSRRFVKTFPVLSTGFEIETEMTIHALDKNFLVSEEPVMYRDRAEGSSSKLSTVRDGTRVLKTVVALFKDYEPLAFFGIASLILLILAVATFLPPLEEYLETGFVRRLPTLVVSIGFGVGALLSLVCAVILDAIRKQSRQFYELLLTAYEASDRLLSSAGGSAAPPVRDTNTG